MQRHDSEATRDWCRSLSRVARDCEDVSEALDSKATTSRLRDLSKPPSAKAGLRKLGIALAIAPEPATTVVGVGLVAASFAMQSNEPASLQTLWEAAGDCFAELGALDLSGLSILL